MVRSHLLGAVGAVDVIGFDDEALVGQRQGALLTVEAVLVPAVALVVHHVGAMAEPCRGERGMSHYIHTAGVRVGLGLAGMVRVMEEAGDSITPV